MLCFLIHGASSLRLGQHRVHAEDLPRAAPGTQLQPRWPWLAQALARLLTRDPRRREAAGRCGFAGHSQEEETQVELEEFSAGAVSSAVLEGSEVAPGSPVMAAVHEFEAI